jgi:hypothetical protein
LKNNNNLKSFYHYWNILLKSLAFFLGRIQRALATFFFKEKRKARTPIFFDTCNKGKILWALETQTFLFSIKQLFIPEKISEKKCKMKKQRFEKMKPKAKLF